MNTESFTYVARCSCGGVVMMAVDNPNDKKVVAREVSGCIKDGYTVTRLSTEFARQQKFCKNHGKCIKANGEQGRLFG